MATPNNLTPTKCSWWPISALESDAGKAPEASEGQEAADPSQWAKESLVLYHWTQSFSSQKRRGINLPKVIEQVNEFPPVCVRALPMPLSPLSPSTPTPTQVRLVIAEKGLPCDERDVSLPLSEPKEPWFMRLNLGEEVPVIIHRDNIISDYDQIIDYVERTFTGEHVAQLIPETGSLLHARVLQYRELLDSLPMDAYTHGCILHPELTTDSMIPKYATAEIRRHLANASTDLMKLDHEEEPQLSEPYLSKQKKLMAKILEHDNVNYLKKILGELAMVLDQIEAELEKRKLEYEGQKCELWLCGCVFTLADVLLGATLHRLKFLGLSKKYWEDGSRPNLQSFFERVQRRFAFRKVLGDIHTTLLSAVIPNAFRLVKRKPPSFFGASFLMGSLGGMGYFAYWYLKKKYI